MINHEFESDQPDGASAAQIQPTHWNAGHVFSGIPLVAEVTLTNSQLLNLHTTHIQILAAPGAGKWIAVLAVWSAFKYGSNPFASSGADPTIGYGNGTNPFNGTLNVEGQTDDSIQTSFDLTANVSIGTSEIANKALNVESVGDPLTGGVGCSLKVSVAYVILDTP